MSSVETTAGWRSRAISWLDSGRALGPLLILASGIGVVFAFLVLGWDGITGTSDYWQTTHNDSLQGIAGLRYYLHESWSSAILSIRDYGAPTGTNIAVTDSIPLLAVPAKAVSGLLPDGFHYFGYWMALSFVMQPVAMTGLLWNLDLRNVVGAFAGAVMALLQTALLTRYFHVALMGQFLIIVSLILGVRILRRNTPKRDLWLLLGLIVVVFFVHLYFYAMVLVVAFAFAIQAVLTGRLAWRDVAGWATAVAAATLLLVYSTGLADAAGFGAAGFRFHSMNALALFGSFEATGGQYEGASYLGIGVLGLIVYVFMEARDELRSALRRYWAPLVAVLALSVYALSTKVWIGLDWSIDVPNVFPISWLGLRFRSSGRFVWPLVYVLVAGAVVLTYRRLGKRAAAPVLLGATLVQIVAMSPTVLDLRQKLHEVEPQVLVAEDWARVVAQHELVRSAPQECVRHDETTARASLELQRISALEDVPVTVVAVSRLVVDCSRQPPTEPLTTGELRIVWHDVVPTYDLPGAYCVDFGLGTACTGTDRSGLVDSLATGSGGSG